MCFLFVKNENSSAGNWDFFTPVAAAFIIFLTVAGVLIFGGIFWW